MEMQSRVAGGIAAALIGLTRFGESDAYEEETQHEPANTETSPLQSSSVATINHTVHSKPLPDVMAKLAIATSSLEPEIKPHLKPIVASNKTFVGDENDLLLNYTETPPNATSNYGIERPLYGGGNSGVPAKPDADAALDIEESRQEAADEAMTAYLERDDGADDWLSSIAAIMADDQDDTDKSVNGLHP